MQTRIDTEEDREESSRASALSGVPDGAVDEGARTVRTLEAEVAALWAELTQRGEILLRYENEVEDLTRAFADLSRSHDDLRRDHETAVKAALAKANARIERIMNSRSMKATAFLRRLGALFAGR